MFTPKQDYWEGEKLDKTPRKESHKQMRQTLQFTFILKKCFVKNTPTKALEQQVSFSFINTSDLFIYLFFSANIERHLTKPGKPWAEWKTHPCVTRACTRSPHSQLKKNTGNCHEKCSVVLKVMANTWEEQESRARDTLELS